MKRTPLTLGRSVRGRMTLLYGGVFTLVALTVLVSVLQLQQRLVDEQVGAFVRHPPVAAIPCDARPVDVPCSVVPFRPPPGDLDGTPATQIIDEKELQRDLAVTQRLVSLLAIAAIVVLAFAVCWWLTGRLLRPLHEVTGTARRLSLSSLHERIAMDGPQDELKDLADTFDAMLDRLERSVAGQRRFVANASHELRTPLAIQRTAIEIGLADPSSPARVTAAREELLRTTVRSERLIEGLLVLAQGEQELDDPAPVDLAAVVDQAVTEHRASAERSGVTVTAATRPVVVEGDEELLARLVANLVQNAIRHNHPGGHVLVDLSPGGGLVVANSGPHVPEERIGELFEPFRRLHRDRTGSSEGAGLGLSIVAAIAGAHGGTVNAVPDPEGGLSITVALPAPAPAPSA